jgi:hypothetical protein
MSESKLWRIVERDLRRVPVVDEAVIERVMEAVRANGAADALGDPGAVAERRSGARRRVSGFLEWLTRPSLALSPAHLAAAVAAVALGVSVFWPRNEPSGIASRGAPRTPPPVITTIVATSASPDGTHEVRFVFVSDSAERVSVAGDFNDWDPGATPLRRVGDGDVWSAVLRVAPGRHLYAFVVDDSTWVTDVTAPRAPETEFGGESSVLFVSRRS